MKQKQIYIFDDGTRIDLARIICIATIDKDEFNRLVLPIFVAGKEKPINIIMGHAVQNATAEQKERVAKIVQGITNAWEQYVFEWVP